MKKKKKGAEFGQLDLDKHQRGTVSEGKRRPRALAWLKFWKQLACYI